jgi:hypothetical protein
MTPHTSHYPRSTIHAFAAAAALAAALALTGCDQLPFGYTTAKEIIAAPGPFEGKEVKIKGKAGDPVQFFGLKMFTVVDETGQISVSTAGSVPAAGADVAVKGVVKSAVIVGGKAVGLHVEETQRIR